MSMNFVNLDELAPEVTKSIVWKEVTHPITELTVGRFKEAIALQAKFDSVTEDSVDDEIIDAYIEMCALTIPTIPPEEIRGWTLKQMMAVMEVIAYTASEDAPTEDEVAETTGKSQEETKTE